MKHLMIDLETMSTRRNAAIVAIGAVRFSDFGEVGSDVTSFYHTIDLQSCVDAGLVMDAGTVEWWMKQDWLARQALFLGRKPLGLVLDNFTLFLQEIRDDIGEEPYIWGNGCGFDNEILKEAFISAGKGYSWDHYKDRDMRTLKWIYQSIGGAEVILSDPPGSSGVPHNALDDAMSQAQTCSRILQKLNEFLRHGGGS